MASIEGSNPTPVAQRAATILDIIGEWFALFPEFNGLVACEIKRHPEVETLLVTGGNCADVMTKVLNWLTEAVN